jgi:hypothetical protein
MHKDIACVRIAAAFNAREWMSGGMHLFEVPSAS